MCGRRTEPEKALVVWIGSRGMDCVYCGSDLSAYDPVYVEETADVRGKRRG
jgi:hypothetical protein